MKRFQTDSNNRLDHDHYSQAPNDRHYQALLAPDGSFEIVPPEHVRSYLRNGYQLP